MKHFNYKEYVASLLFLTIVPSAAHFLFSWIGFNLADDGFILAYSRRILEGQMPHRDFISIRPILSALLHCPVVYFGGEYTYWISRYFVWFQSGVIAWCFTLFIDRSLHLSYTDTEKFILASLAFLFSTNTWPPMAWHTTDGLFFIAIGLLLTLRPSAMAKFIGYFLVALSYLCKQNFLPVGFIAIFALQDWKKSYCWLGLSLPAILYVIVLIFTHSLADAVMQITSQHDIVDAGIRSYLHNRRFFAGIIFGWVSMFLLLKENPLNNAKIHLLKLTASILLYGVIISFALSLYNNTHIALSAFLLFGSTVGCTLFFLFKREIAWSWVSTGAIVISIGWSVSISIGIKSPVPAAGHLMLLITGYHFLAITPFYRNKNLLRNQQYRTYEVNKIFSFCLMLILLAVTTVSYIHARRQYVLFDNPAKELTESISDVFPGTKLIKTNKNYYELFLDLREAVRRAKGKVAIMYGILPGYWVKAPQINPLSIDLGHGDELNNDKLNERIIKDCEKYKGEMTVIVPKIRMEFTRRGFILFDHKGYRNLVGFGSSDCLAYIFENYIPYDETKFFVLYK